MKSLSRQKSSLAKLRELRWQERWLLLRAFAVLTTYKWLLFVLPFRVFLPPSNRVDAGEALSDDVAEDKLRRVIWAIQVLSARLPLGFTCLVQALSAKWLLHNHPAIRIFIGVQKTENQPFAAHAWIVYKGKTILGERVNQEFAPILHWS